MPIATGAKPAFGDNEPRVCSIAPLTGFGLHLLHLILDCLRFHEIASPHLLLAWSSVLWHEIAVGLALAHHFLTIGIQGVIDDPLGGVLLMVVFVAQVAEAFGNRLQPWPLRLVPQGVIGICAIDD